MAAHDYEERKAMIARTTRLKALRLAKEAADRLVRPVKATEARKPPRRKARPSVMPR